MCTHTCGLQDGYRGVKEGIEFKGIFVGGRGTDRDSTAAESHCRWLHKILISPVGKLLEASEQSFKVEPRCRGLALSKTGCGTTAVSKASCKTIEVRHSTQPWRVGGWVNGSSGWSSNGGYVELKTQSARWSLKPRNRSPNDRSMC